MSISVSYFCQNFDRKNFVLFLERAIRSWCESVVKRLLCAAGYAVRDVAKSTELLLTSMSTNVEG